MTDTADSRNMKKIKRFTTTLITILSGATFTSLCITHTETWRWGISIILIAISFKLIVEND